MPKYINWREYELVTCPFYQRDGGAVIVCEAPGEYNECKAVLYVTPDNKRRYMTCYCQDGYDKCSVHNHIMQKYK